MFGDEKQHQKINLAKPLYPYAVMPEQNYVLFWKKYNAANFWKQ